MEYPSPDRLFDLAKDKPTPPIQLWGQQVRNKKELAQLMLGAAGLGFVSIGVVLVYPDHYDIETRLDLMQKLQVRLEAMGYFVFWHNDKLIIDWLDTNRASVAQLNASFDTLSHDGVWEVDFG